MSVLGNLSAKRHLSEFMTGYAGKTAAQRQALARRSLGIGGGALGVARSFLVPCGGNAKVGATAGWVITAADNKLHATLPASQSASTLVLPIAGLEVGDTIMGFNIICQFQSVGGVATLDADFRKQLVAAADNTDSSVGAITQVSVTAQTASQAAKTFTTPEVVVAGTQYYVLFTGTTAASTDEDLLGVVVSIKKA